MSVETLSVTIDYAPLKALFKEMPKIANSELNTGYKQIASGFMKEFTNSRLVKGVFYPHRKGTFKNQRGQPALPKRALMAGFVAKLKGRERLDGKSVEVRNSNPLILGRERGRPIVPRKSKPDSKGRRWLYIRVDPKGVFGRSKKGKARHQKWKNKQFASYHGTGGHRVIVAKVQKVGPFPLLGFRAAWRSYESRLPKLHYEKITSRIVGRAQRFAGYRRAA